MAAKSKKYADQSRNLDDFMKGNFSNTALSERAVEELNKAKVYNVKSLMDLDLEGYYMNMKISKQVYKELNAYVSFINQKTHDFRTYEYELKRVDETLSEKLAKIPSYEYVYLGGRSGWTSVRTAPELLAILNEELEPLTKEEETEFKNIRRFKDRKIVEVYPIDGLTPHGVAIKVEGKKGDVDGKYGLPPESPEERKRIKVYSPSLKEVKAAAKDPSKRTMEDISKEWDAAVSAIRSIPDTKTTDGKPPRDRMIIKYKRKKSPKKEEEKKEVTEDGFRDEVL